MTRWLKRPNKKTGVILGVSLSIIPLLVFIFWALGIIFTYTGSIPIGFYRTVHGAGHIRRGDIIAFCLPDKVAAIGLKRGYLHRGTCANGSEALIKQVIAVPGDTVTITDQKITVDIATLGIDYFAPTHVIDKDHLPVVRFIKAGTYQAKGYWVYGFGSPHYSWDSRYYGGIPKGNIAHRLVPLWQF